MAAEPSEGRGWNSKCTWRLLKLDELLVCELGAVVDELERVVGAAVLAERRLGDASALDLGRRRVATHGALEEGLPHLRDQVRQTNHHPADRDQLVDVCNKHEEQI